MYKFGIWLLGFITPFLIVYLIVNFISWGNNWNPGDWHEQSRALIAVLYFLWSLAWTAIFLEEIA